MEYWSSIQKNVFRFFFLFLGITTLLCYNVIFEVLDLRQNGAQRVYRFLSFPLAWIDVHFFHIGLNTRRDLALFADGHFGWVALPTLLITCLVGATVWALVDRKPRNYDRWHFWFNSYLAFYLFFPMMGYGLEKTFAVQMPYPNIVSLLSPLGQKTGQAVVWDFIGVSPAYSFFTGFCEVAGGVLVLFRRTRVAGALMVAAVLTNVVCLNVFYNIQVKLLCMELLLTDLFILAPYLSKLFKFFYQLQPVSLAERTYSLPKPWKNCLLVSLSVVIAWTTFSDIKRTASFASKDKDVRKEQRLYNVATFILGKDTLLPLPDDTIRWKRLAFTDYQGQRFGVIFNMKDVDDWYRYHFDDHRRAVTLTDDPDTTKKYMFALTESPNDSISLTGIWKGKSVKIFLNRVPIDSLPLVRERTIWVQAY